MRPPAAAAGREALTEADLQALGIVRIPVPIPFVQAGGPVNVYLIDDAEGGLTLFDAGLGSPQAQAALADGFAAAGRRFDEVRRIVLSHGHVDHYGAAAWIQEQAGRPVPVHVHAADDAKVVESGPRWRELIPRYRAHLARLGVPPEVLAAIDAEVGRGFALARRLPDVRPLQPGEVLRGRHLALEVMHMPGHTPGLCCLYDRERRLFFSADHLLEYVSPNPILELGPDGEEGFFRPLVAYLTSVQRLRALEVDLVLPGHGPPFGGHRAIIDGLLGFYARRQTRLRALLAEGPRTGFELTRALFPGARSGDAFLVISETVANLEVLEARGEVTRTVREGAYRFTLAA